MWGILSAYTYQCSNSATPETHLSPTNVCTNMQDCFITSSIGRKASPACLFVRPLTARYKTAHVLTLQAHHPALPLTGWSVCQSWRHPSCYCPHPMQPSSTGPDLSPYQAWTVHLIQLPHAVARHHVMCPHHAPPPKRSLFPMSVPLLMLRQALAPHAWVTNWGEGVTMKPAGRVCVGERRLGVVWILPCVTSWAAVV